MNRLTLCDNDRLRSDIRNVKVVVKYGAFGNSDAMGVWIYGKRRDGRTVGCKNETLDDGSVVIWSEYWKGDEIVEDITVFCRAEWQRLRNLPEVEQRWTCNEILDARH